MPTSIKISQMLPLVFAEERQRHEASEIWLTEKELLPGHTYLIKAESGAGKSSLCAFLFGNRHDYEGTLTINNRDARSFSPEEWVTLRRNVMAYLPQDMGLFPPLTAMENILLKNRLTNHKSQTEIMEMLKAVGMADFVDRKAERLSIGQQQRIAIVRSLCQPFDIILLDEPVSHLDEASNLAVAQLIEREAKANNATILVTSVGNNLRLDNYELLNL
jgi:ABC-type lipoprotein export system ATPase subunit